MNARLKIRLQWYDHTVHSTLPNEPTKHKMIVQLSRSGVSATIIASVACLSQGILDWYLLDNQVIPIWNQLDTRKILRRSPCETDENTTLCRLLAPSSNCVQSAPVDPEFGNTGAEFAAMRRRWRRRRACIALFVVLGLRFCSRRTAWSSHRASAQLCRFVARLSCLPQRRCSWPREHKLK